MSHLEMKLEQKDKEDKNKNIVIRGLEVEEKEASKSVEVLIKEKLGISASIEKTDVINMKSNQKIIIVKVTTWKDKKEIMQQKRKLKGTNIFIDEDRTKDERRIQRLIREKSYVEKRKRNKERVGSKKFV
ncbi:hypothetical protein ILUMI_11341 [Ignelater luminosus]|uniref:Uncharacterized protein n=1 Tax=Ignelater luminosus TaxID=2038154 RepID=A0A8K0CW50_IGNLU|nr:hypothetical protein ILUMI_11341 [Ignelater luminosus]